MVLLNLDFQTVVALCLAFALGGLMISVTGSGSPVIAIPILAVFIDAKLADAYGTSEFFSDLISI